MNKQICFTIYLQCSESGEQGQEVKSFKTRKIISLEESNQVKDALCTFIVHSQNQVADSCMTEPKTA